jgi:predicted DNA-binding protein
MKLKSNVFAVRLSPVVIFLLRKMSEHTGNPIGFVVAEAVHKYVNTYPISRTRMAKWLREYRATEEEKIEPNNT